MLAKELITDEVPPLRVSDTGQKALNWMEEFKVSHLPVVKGSKYCGLISDDEIIDFNDPKATVDKIMNGATLPCVQEDNHIFDIIKQVSEFNLTLIPVLDKNSNYIGNIPALHLLKKISEISGINDTGSIIVLELNIRDYSLTEISRIVESNNYKIISSYVATHPDSTKMDVTIKLNKLEISPVIQTFLRYNYVIKASFNDNSLEEDLQDRFEGLMKFLDI